MLEVEYLQYLLTIVLNVKVNLNVESVLVSSALKVTLLSPNIILVVDLPWAHC